MLEDIWDMNDELPTVSTVSGNLRLFNDFHEPRLQLVSPSDLPILDLHASMFGLF